MKANIELLTARAAEKWFASSDRSRLRFFNVTAEVARGTGVTYRPDLKRIMRQIRTKMRGYNAEPRRPRHAAR